MSLTRGVKLISHLVLDLFVSTRVKNITNVLSHDDKNRRVVLVNAIDDHVGDGNDDDENNDDDDDLEMVIDGNQCIREFRDLYCSRG